MMATASSLLLRRGAKASFVAYAGRQAVGREQLLELMEGLGSGAQRFTERGQTRWHNHELLDLETTVGVHAAVDDVHEGRGQDACLRAAEVTPQRKAHRLRGSARVGHGAAENRVGTETLFIVRPVEGDQCAVDGALIERIKTEQGRCDLFD